jgi:choloylglycine hydrolase
VFHILNNFDIVKGVVRDKHEGEVAEDYTQWTTASDLKNLRFYYRTYADQRIRFVDLRNLDWIDAGVARMPVEDEEQTFEDVTDRIGKGTHRPGR